MSGLAIALIVIAVWVAIGLVTAWWMARRGHRDPGWLLMAVVFGPVLAVVAGERIARRPGLLTRREYGRRRAGRLRVLVGLDGSTEAQRALDLAVELLGPCAGVLLIAEVVDYDAAETDWRGLVAAAQERLRAVVDASAGAVTSCEVLSGPPAQALVRYANEQLIDVVVVGSHGQGLSKALLGNVARELVRMAAVPVLVAGGRYSGARG